MNGSHRARLWRTGLLLVWLCGGLAAVMAAPPSGPDLDVQKQVPKGDDDLFQPRRSGERALTPEQKKILDEVRKKPDPTIEANLPQRAPSILPDEMNAIDLGCVLRLAGVNNPDILLARQRVARRRLCSFWPIRSFCRT